MKITMASYQAAGLVHGGPLVQVLHTKKELEKLGVDVTLLDPWKSLPRKECDIVHLFAANLGTFHLARNIVKSGIPLVTSPIFYTRHSPSFIRASVLIEKAAKKLRPALWTDYGFTRQVCLWSQAVLPNTRDEQRLLDLGMGIPGSTMFLIPNGVEKRFRSADPTLFRKKFGVSNFILHVGHIGPPRKNVLNFIRALKTIDHPAVIIGKVTLDESGKRCMDEAARNKNIVIIPGLDHSSPLLASAYAACDVFALPSLFETPGIAALEAGLAGAKIVITPFGGTREYFGTMAEYVDPFSIESIRNGITAALSTKKSDDLSRHIEKEYLWRHVAEKTLEVYKKILQP